MDEVETKELIEIFNVLIGDLKKESDRGSVLVVSTLIENELENSIESRLLNKANSTDIVSKVVRSFGAKIDFSYRLGIITPPEREIYHQLRELRNACAHEIEEQNFDKAHFKERIENIIKESAFIWELLKNKAPIPNSDNDDNISIKSYVEFMGWRACFEIFFSLMIAHKKASKKRVKKIKPLYNPEQYT